MSRSVNKVILVGNLGRDPEIRSTQNGDRIANLQIATSESWKDKNSGESRERTEWHRVVVFNDGLIDVIECYLKKGSKLYVEGALQTRKWQDSDGNDRYSTEVVLQKYRGELVLLGDRADQSERPAAPRESARPATEAHRGGGRAYDDLDSEIPF